MTSGAARRWVVAAACLAALAGMVAADSWRVALLAALSATAVLATRVRYAGIAAAALLALVAVVSLTGHAAGRDDRVAQVPASAASSPGVPRPAR